MCDTNKGSPHSPLHVMKCMVLNSVMYYLSQICYLLFAIEKRIGTSWVFFRRPVVFCIFYGQAETKQEVNWKVKVLNSIIMNLLNQSKQLTHTDFTQITRKIPPTGETNACLHKETNYFCKHSHFHPLYLFRECLRDS